MFVNILLSALLAGSALATPNPNPEPAANAVHQVQIRQVSASTTGATSTASNCIAIAEGIFTLASGEPTLPPALMIPAAQVSDICATPTLTGVLSSEYASYQSAVLSWYAVHSSEINSWTSSFYSECPGASSSISLVSIPTCLPTVAAGGSSSGSGNSIASTSSSVASPTKNGALAPRQTGFAVAAGMVAGFVGAVAAL